MPKTKAAKLKAVPSARLLSVLAARKFIPLENFVLLQYLALQQHHLALVLQ